MGQLYLLDTHVLVRWMIDAKRLSKEHSRVIEKAVAQGESLSVCTMTLLEIAVLFGDGRIKLSAGLEHFFGLVRSSPVLRILPLDYTIAVDVASLANLRDPADRAIVATARVHGMVLLTSDSRIIDSGLVAVVE